MKLTITIENASESTIDFLWGRIKEGFPELGNNIRTDNIVIDWELAFKRYNDALRDVICSSFSIHCGQVYYNKLKNANNATESTVTGSI